MQRETRQQIANLALSPEKPLLIVDADEVLVHFAQPFETFLAMQGWQLHLTEYKLEYAIRKADGFVADVEKTFDLVHRFIDEKTREQPVIQGAANALQYLSTSAQIVVLSNVPQRRFQDRVANLHGHGLEFPLVANVGPKGPALSFLTQNMRAPVAFVDDSPAQIESAAEHAGHIHRIHFAGCPVIRRVLPDVKCADATPPDWQGVASHIDNLFGKSRP